ncbi:preprotein translocase subunit SecE [Lederbergia wuyishanensis]|uniref:Protein translocase subunit SecE n=1 Tax=Lederbergia wuyishanensis TaxID=1347903 RepID=A0ABU0DAD1_9BACI|nr:preprotein translocase subunit SecE [Lederbergia wuyishanensis]MCJ8009744.1 preprotein translocase subunit SecE [Lederbergia wuyishanensis]MDQ0345379.1 preprotein translocase subunit SecE [Lederbergia wuyishanensis]
MSSLTQFFRNVSSEMRKVSWPRRKELTGYTITVVATVTILALFFAGVDLVISKAIRFILGM